MYRDRLMVQVLIRQQTRFQVDFMALPALIMFVMSFLFGQHICMPFTNTGDMRTPKLQECMTMMSSTKAEYFVTSEACK
jgi:hypothetical protein